MVATSATGIGQGSSEGPVRGLGPLEKVMTQNNVPAFTIEDDTYVLTIEGGSGGGEANTGSNVGTDGIGVFKRKLGVDLEFRTINRNSAKVSVTQDTINNEVRIDIDETQISHDNLADVGTNTHAQIDSHLSSQTNPHNVTLEQARTQDSQLSGDLYMGGYAIKNLVDPVDPSDATNKSYVDSVATGLVIEHAPVRVATTGNLNATYAPMTLTANGNGALSVDGVSPIVADRILVKNQTAATDNGIYVVTATGDGGNPYVLTRASDFNQTSEISAGDFIFVEEGTANANSGFVQVTVNPVLDTDDLVFNQFSAAGTITAGAGLNKVGDELSVNVDDSTIEINADTLRVKNAGITNAKLDKSNIPLSGFGAPTTSVSLGSQKITNLAAPTLVADAARLQDTMLLTLTRVADYLINGAYKVILCNGTFNVTLPAVHSNGEHYHIKNIGNGIITLVGNGSTVDGANSILISNQYMSLNVVSDGSNWHIL